MFCVCPVGKKKEGTKEGGLSRFLESRLPLPSFLPFSKQVRSSITSRVRHGNESVSVLTETWVTSGEGMADIPTLRGWATQRWQY